MEGMTLSACHAIFHLCLTHLVAALSDLLTSQPTVNIAADNAAAVAAAAAATSSNSDEQTTSDVNRLRPVYALTNASFQAHI